MEVPHGIGVTNRFDIFYNEDVDPFEILKQQEEERQKRKIEKTMKDKVKPVKTSKIVSTSSPKKPLETAKPTKDAGEVPNKVRGKPNERPPRSTGNFPESKEVEKNARNKDDQFFNPDQRDSDFRRGRGGYRGRGGRDRGRGFFPNAEGRNRRVFDRHSGSDKTGVRPTDKREGAGPNNWGDIRSDMNQRNDEAGWEEEFEAGGDRSRGPGNWPDEEPSESAKFGDDAQKGENEVAHDNSESKENDQTTDEQIQEAVKEMTLDEYKREIEAKKTVHKFNIRKPGEGEDEKQWKKGYVLKKKLPVEEEDQDDEEEEEEEYGRKGQQKVLLDFQFNFTDSRRGMRGRGRGGRGGPRGGGGRDMNRDSPREDRMRENRSGRGGRGDMPPKVKPGQQAPRVDDFNDFPSLNNA